jgi:VanZ family protein
MKYIPAIFITVLILIVVSIPGQKLPHTSFSGMDKAAHLLFFCSWSLAIQFGFTIRHRWTWILVIGFLFGASTEVLQIFAKGRSADLLDLTFDAMGLTLAAWCGPILMPLAEKIWPLSRWTARAKNLRND